MKLKLDQIEEMVQLVIISFYFVFLTFCKLLIHKQIYFRLGSRRKKTVAENQEPESIVRYKIIKL